MGGSLIVVYRFRMTLSEYGSDESYGERVLEAFVATHPEVGAVVSQSTKANTLTVVFSVEAETADAAIQHGREVFAAGGAASGLPMTELLEANVILVASGDNSERDEERELQPA
jgi:hypothetical protein